MNYCGKCGQQVSDGNRFCTNCGASVENVEQEAQKTEFDSASNAKKKGKKPIIIAILAVIAALSACFIFFICMGEDYESLVQNGYLGEYTDVTVKELLREHYGELYDTETWNSGETKDGREIVEVVFSDSDKYLDSVTLQFEILNDDCFKISAYKDYNFENSTGRMVALNYMYYLHCTSSFNYNSAKKQQAEVLKRLNNVSGSAVMYGASAKYDGNRSELYKLFGDDELQISVPMLLDTYGFINLEDFSEYLGFNNAGSGYTDFADDMVDLYENPEIPYVKYPNFEYEDVIQKYTTALNQQWDREELEAANINYLFWYDYTPNNYGYAILDFDHNGINELFIGQIGEYGGLDGQIMDLYTLVDGVPTLVISAGERDRYYLCENGFIKNDGASSAYESQTAYYSGIDKYGCLIFSEAVIVDGEITGTSYNPYYYFSADSSDYVSISEEKAEQIDRKYTHKGINYTPFETY